MIACTFMVSEVARFPVHKILSGRQCHGAGTSRLVFISIITDHGYDFTGTETGIS